MNCHHDLRDIKNSYILLYFPLTILPSSNSCHYWGTERRQNVRREASNTFTFPLSHLRDADSKKFFQSMFYDWSNVLDASQATLAMAGARKDGKNARAEACLACAGPCVATGLIWPPGLAWVGSLWPDVPAWVSLCGLGLRKLLYAACWSFDMPHHHSGQASQPHVCNVN